MANLVDNPGTVTCRHRRIVWRQDRWPDGSRWVTDQLTRATLDHEMVASGAWSECCQALTAEESLVQYGVVSANAGVLCYCPGGNGGVSYEGLTGTTRRLLRCPEQKEPAAA